MDLMPISYVACRMPGEPRVTPRHRLRKLHRRVTMSDSERHGINDGACYVRHLSKQLDICDALVEKHTSKGYDSRLGKRDEMLCSVSNT